MGELITFIGSTDGTSTTGVVSLDSDILYSQVQYVRIPRGMVAKIWFKKVSGDVETDFILQYSNDVTVSTPTWKDIQVEKLPSSGEISIEKRRPEILRSFTGREGFRVTWSQPTAGLAHIELGVEFE